jgi:hypothetical protein
MSTPVSSPAAERELTNVTAPEQCLEQVEIVSGSVLSECPKG